MRIRFLLIPLFLLFVGCTRCKVGVNGFSSTGENLQIPQASSICVLNSDDASNPIFEKEIANKIQKLLNVKGYGVTSQDNADYYILFEYGIDSGRTMTGSRPVYHAGGTATASTFNSYGGMSYSTIQTPGYTTHVPYSATKYTRGLLLKLIDGKMYRQSKEVEPLWIGEITSSGSSSDLRDVINYMLVPAFEHFGENTGKRLDQTIFMWDSRAKALMGP